jgi:hypothetical protein
LAVSCAAADRAEAANSKSARTENLQTGIKVMFEAILFDLIP